MYRIMLAMLELWRWEASLLQLQTNSGKLPTVAVAGQTEAREGERKSHCCNICGAKKEERMLSVEVLANQQVIVVRNVKLVLGGSKSPFVIQCKHF